MFRANPAASGGSTPIALRRARWGETFEESKRVSTRQNARAAPSCATDAAEGEGARSVEASCEVEAINKPDRAGQVAHAHSHCSEGCVIVLVPSLVTESANSSSNI